jgi:hypothetical protein
MEYTALRTTVCAVVYREGKIHRKSKYPTKLISPSLWQKIMGKGNSETIGGFNRIKLFLLLRVKPSAAVRFKLPQLLSKRAVTSQ